MRKLLERFSRILVIVVVALGALLALGLIVGAAVFVLSVVFGSHPH